MLVSTYLVNLLCAVVECRGRMPFPEAYIAEYTDPPFPATRNVTHIKFNSNNIYTDNDLDRDRSKRLFPFQQNEKDYSTRTNQNSSSIANVIPNFFSSLSRVFKNGNSLDNSGFNNFRSDGRIEGRMGRNLHGDPLPVVLLKHGGGVEGYYMGTMSGRKISAYEGIRYALEPTGNRRFKPPEPAKPWKGIREAKKPSSTCIQTHPVYIFRVTGAEDCLFANIYSPLIPYKNNDKLFPVLIFIHGGSFMYGSGSEYGPAYLLSSNDIVLVTFNYRLGALGFLSTGDEESPGNYGLKDQALAIQFVYENIRNFGGDPTRITIAGQSAGAVSAHLHLIANKVTNYFHNGISMSGSGFGFWPIQSKEKAMRLTISLAKRLNCPYRSSSELLRCLRGMSGSWIIMTQLQLFDWVPFHPLVLFSPIVEPEGPGAYLTKTPAYAYANKEVKSKPWIFGETLKEGHFETYILKLFMQRTNMALNVKRYLPIILDYEYYTSEPATTQLTETLMRAYDGDSNKDGLSMDTISDAIYAHSQIAPTKTFAWLFDYVGKYNLGELFGVPQSEWSSAHAEDSMMIFNSSSYHHGLSTRDEEYQLSEIMTSVVSNFVATSKPDYRDKSGDIVEVWDNAVDYLDAMGPRIRYLRFGNTIGMIDDPFHERVKFWEKLGIPI